MGKMAAVWWWLGRGVKRAKRTQFCQPGSSRLRIADCRLRIEGGRLWAGAGGQMRKTNPIWASRWQVRQRENAQNEPNLAGGAGGPPSALRPRAPAQGDCAKRTQFPAGVSSWKCQVFREQSAPVTSNCPLHTSNVVRNGPASVVPTCRWPPERQGRRLRAQKAVKWPGGWADTPDLKDGSGWAARILGSETTRDANV
jgi:hypothetical protein